MILNIIYFLGIIPAIWLFVEVRLGAPGHEITLSDAIVILFAGFMWPILAAGGLFILVIAGLVLLSERALPAWASKDISDPVLFRRKSPAE